MGQPTVLEQLFHAKSCKRCSNNRRCCRPPSSRKCKYKGEVAVGKSLTVRWICMLREVWRFLVVRTASRDPLMPQIPEQTRVNAFNHSHPPSTAQVVMYRGKVRTRRLWAGKIVETISAYHRISQLSCKLKLRFSSRTHRRGLIRRQKKDNKPTVRRSASRTNNSHWEALVCSTTQDRIKDKGLSTALLDHKIIRHLEVPQELRKILQTIRVSLV